jgi:hypothetical protein
MNYFDLSKTSLDDETLNISKMEEGSIISSYSSKETNTEKVVSA